MRCPFGTGGVGTPSEASWSTRRSAAVPSGRSWTRYSVGTRREVSSCATCSLAAIIRCSIIRWDSVCSTGSADDDVAPLVELELGLAGLERQRRLRGPPFLERGRRRARDLERRAPAAGGAGPAVEDAVDAPVVEPLVGADHRAVERAAADAGAVEHDLDRDREAILPRDERAGAIRERLGQHRLDRARHVHARAAPVGLTVEQRAGAHVGRHVGDVDPHPPRAVVLGGGRDRVVEVARGHRVDGECRQRTQVAPAGGNPRVVAVAERSCRHLAGLVLDRGIEPAPQASVDHQPLDHVARDVRAADPPDDRRPPPAAPVARRAGADDDQVADRRLAIAADHRPGTRAEERLGDEELAPPSQHRHPRAAARVR